MALNLKSCRLQHAPAWALREEIDAIAYAVECSGEMSFDESVKQLDNASVALRQAVDSIDCAYALDDRGFANERMAA